MRQIVLAACAALSVGACGTVTRGTSEQVSFASAPPGAAVTTTKGYACPATPCSIDIDRKDEFNATFTLTGHRPEIVSVRSRLAPSGGAALAGNVLIGGIIGIGVDAMTGAPYDHFPNPVVVTLTPEHPAAVARRPSRRGRAKVSELET